MTQAPAFIDPDPASADPRMTFSQPCLRNRAPILAVLQLELPKGGLMLEIGAGTGQHAAYFAPHFPGLTWQPTDIDEASHASIAAWAQASRENTGATNICPPLVLDVTAKDWQPTNASCVMSANMIHIAPWECCLGLMAGAAITLMENGVLALYGPFKQDGAQTADSNASFDASLRARDPAWGIRDLEAVIDSAAAQGLAHQKTISMPANNLMLIFRRQG